MKGAMLYMAKLLHADLKGNGRALFGHLLKKGLSDILEAVIVWEAIHRASFLI